MRTSKLIREAALFKTPNEPWRVGSWLPGRGDNGAAWGAILERIEHIEDWWDRRTPIEARRMFLLMVSLELAEIEAANAAAYHGDVDGDLAGYDGA